jgi:Double-stranded RNA binding motif
MPGLQVASASSTAGPTPNFISTNSNLTPLGKRDRTKSSGGEPTTAVAVVAASADPSGGGLPPAAGEKSPVQLINEMLARLGQGPAAFELMSQGGPPNAPFFLMQVRLVDQTYTGEGRSKKLAKTRAAEKALLDTEAWYWPGMRQRQRDEEKSGGGDEKGDISGGGAGEEHKDDESRQPGSYPK